MPGDRQGPAIEEEDFESVSPKRGSQESDFLNSDQENGWRPAFKERIPCHLQRGVSSS